MDTNAEAPNENMELLMEIFFLKYRLEELRDEKGPAHRDYISLSLELKSMMNDYFEEKMEYFMPMAEYKSIKKRTQLDDSDPAIRASQKLDKLISRIHKVNYLGFSAPGESRES